MAKFMRAAGRATGCAGVAKVAAGDVDIDLRRARPGRPRACPPSAAVDRRPCARGSRGRPSSATAAGPPASRGRTGRRRSARRAAPRSRTPRSPGSRARTARSARPGRALGGAGTRAPVGLEAADGLQQRQRLAVAQVRLGLSPPSGQRHAQHPQDHVGGLDRRARLQERVGLVAQHRAPGHAPEQPAALAHVRVDRVRAGLHGGARRCAAAGRGGTC